MLGLGLIGTGFMGKALALAYRAAPAVTGDGSDVRLEALCDVSAVRADAMAGQLGLARATEDWQDVAGDPAVDIVSVTQPNALHHEMALAAIAARKHVHCEKPLALTMKEAEEIEAAARAAGTRAMVGYNYIHLHP